MSAISHATDLNNEPNEKIILIRQKQIGGIEHSYLVTCDSHRHLHTIKNGESTKTMIHPCDCINPTSNNKKKGGNK